MGVIPCSTYDRYTARIVLLRALYLAGSVIRLPYHEARKSQRTLTISRIFM